MALLLRQGRVQMELSVGLLILLGMTLEGSEGLRCINGEVVHEKYAMECPDKDLPCYQGWAGNGVIRRSCYSVPLDKECMYREFNTGYFACLETGSEVDLNKTEGCIIDNQRPVQNDTEDDPPNGRRNGKGLDWKKNRNDHIGLDKVCVCFEDLCNDADAGRSGVNDQVIFGVLGVAAILTFQVEMGSF